MSTTFHFDAVGNRKCIASTLPTINTWNYTYDANDRITGFAAPPYDNDGNITWQAGTQESYDYENHLVGSGYIAYVYDGDGNRVAKTIAGATTNYLVDTLNPTGYAQVLDELQSGTVSRSYAWGMQQISESQLTAAVPPANPWVTSYYGFDGHGSVRYLTSSTGAVTDTYDYDAFGNLINSIGSTPNNYLFAGEQFDPDLGLYYNRARYLDVHAGRFWGMDTRTTHLLNNPSELHQYLYASANPVNRVDPSGMDDIAELSVSAEIGGQASAIEAEGQAVAYQAQALAEEASTLESDAVQETSNAFSNWQDAENAVRESEGGVKATFETPQGQTRFVDSFNPVNGTATEVKYGYKAATQFIEKQVAKDVAIRDAEGSAVKKVIWKFFTSAATGEGGPSGPLLELLQGNGIEVWVNGVIVP